MQALLGAQRPVHLDLRPHSINMGIDEVGPNIPMIFLVENGECKFKPGISDTVELYRFTRTSSSYPPRLASAVRADSSTTSQRK